MKNYKLVSEMLEIHEGKKLPIFLTVAGVVALTMAVYKKHKKTKGAKHAAKIAAKYSNDLAEITKRSGRVKAMETAKEMNEKFTDMVDVIDI